MPAILVVNSKCVTGAVLSCAISLLGGQSLPGNEPAEENESEIQ